MDTLSAYRENPSGCRSPFRNRYAFNSGLIILGFSISSHLILYLQKTLAIASRLSDCLSPQYSPFEFRLLNAELFAEILFRCRYCFDLHYCYFTFLSTYSDVRYSYQEVPLQWQIQGAPNQSRRQTTGREWLIRTRLIRSNIFLSFP